MFPIVKPLSAVAFVSKGLGIIPSMLMSSLEIAAELAARKAVDIEGRDAGPCVGAVQQKSRKGSYSDKIDCERTENQIRRMRKRCNYQ